MRKRVCVLFLLSAHVAMPAQETSPVPSVTISVGQLLALAGSDTLPRILSEQFPANIAFRVDRWYQAIKPEMARVIVAREKYFSKSSLWKKSDDGERYIPVPGSQNQAQEEFSGVLAEKFQIAVNPLSMDEDLPGVKLSALDIQTLGPLIREKKEKTP